MSDSNGSADHPPFSPPVEGVVEAVNARGIKVNGTWINVSQFRPVALPQVGEYVRVKVTPKGFIHILEVIKAVPGTDATPPPNGAARSSRDRTISRLSVLKSAASFAAGRDDIKSADVLRIATAWLAWVDQEQNPVD